MLDARVHAYRRDLADIELAGKILAPHYARPVIRSCGALPTFVRDEPDSGGRCLSQLLPGEDFAVLEYAAGWAWGYCRADHVVGYVEAIELADCQISTHIVCERCAPVAADSRITSPVLATLPMGSRLHGIEQANCLTTEYGCVSLSHLRRVSEKDDDPALVAERLIGAPYLEGGRTSEGVDGPGLVQLALSLCGVDAPRLADLQRDLGTPVASGALRRNDLVFGTDIAALMIDDLLMIQASPAAGKVTIEPVRKIENVEARRLPL